MGRYPPGTAVLLAVLLCLAGCNDPAAPVPIEADKESLVVYTSHSEEVYAPVIKEFKERTGIWVTVNTGGSNELLEQISAERDAPQCDVMFGGFTLSHKVYEECFERYRSTEADAILPAHLVDEDLSTPFSVLPIVIIYNSKVVLPRNIPSGWASLLEEHWESRIAFADPSASVSSYVALTAIMQALPHDRWETLDRFADNLGGQLTGSADLPHKVADGIYLAGIALEEAALRQVRTGLEISVVYPAEGTSIMSDATALIKNAPLPELARQFIDFTVSRDIQQMIANDLSRRPVRTDVELPRWMPPLSDIPALEYDTGWSIANWDAILTRWESLME